MQRNAQEEEGPVLLRPQSLGLLGHDQTKQLADLRQAFPQLLVEVSEFTQTRRAGREALLEAGQGLKRHQAVDTLRIHQVSHLHLLDDGYDGVRVVTDRGGAASRLKVLSSFNCVKGDSSLRQHRHSQEA